MSDPTLLVTVCVAFLLAGVAKGVLGLGMPTVSLALLTTTLGLHPAMALLVVPTFVTNVWQALAGGHGRSVVLRTWPFLVAATATIGIGALALTRVDVRLLSALLGVLLMSYALLGLTGPGIAIPRSWEAWAGPASGALNGLLMGLTGSGVVPGVLYLQAIGLPRDVLVQAMGMLFTLSAVGLAFSLAGQQLLSVELGALSTGAVVPAVVGMALGRRVRRGIDEARFRQVFLAALLLLGLALVLRSLLSPQA